MTERASLLAIIHATVVDVEAGQKLRDYTVVVRDDRIVAVGPAGRVRVPAGAKRIDGRGRTVIPGLWDMHVHALWHPEVVRVFMPLFVTHGITGVRDMGGVLSLLAPTRRRIAEGALIGPEIVAAGAILDGPQPVQRDVSLAVADAAAVAEAVGTLVQAGADFLKVYTQLPRDAWTAVIAEGNRRGLAVAGHVPAEVTPAAAAAAGQRSIEHLRDELELYCTQATRAACAPTFEALHTHHTWQVPTLVALYAKAFQNDDALVVDPRVARLPAVVRQDWLSRRDAKLRRATPAYWTARRARFAESLWLVGALHQASVPILAGTDAGDAFAHPGSGLHEELAWLVRAGLSPLDALRAATIEPARYLKRAHELGSVTAGKRADLVLLDGDPLEDITNTRHIHAVILRGKYIAP